MWCCWICPGHDPVATQQPRSGARCEQQCLCIAFTDAKDDRMRWGGTSTPSFSKSGRTKKEIAPRGSLEGHEKEAVGRFKANNSA